MSKIRRVSWKNKEEWIRVYELAFSSDFVQVEQAVTHMKTWLSRGLCPGGVKCTVELLTYVCRDRSFFPSLPSERLLPDDQLQFAYSSVIMRFLNVLYETNKSDDLTLYRKAKLIGLEDWLVHIRHLTAHGKQLPSLDFLRLGVAHTLQWLKENYWEVERTASEDLVIHKPLIQMHREKLTELLALFTRISEQQLSDIKNIDDIQDLENKQYIQTGIDKLNDLSAQTIPWNAPLEKLPCSAPRTRDLANLSTVICKLIKSYFKRHEITEQSCSLLVDFLVQDHFNFHKIRSEVFGTLLKKLHAWQVLGKLIEVLVDRAFPRQVRGVEAKIAGDWLVDLLKAIVKRFKAEELFVVLSKESMGRRSAKIRARLTPDERSRLVRTLLRKRLSIQTGQSTQDVKILATLVHRVEKKYPTLKSALRLREPVFITGRILLDLLYKVCQEPNSYTLPVVDLLGDLLSFRRAITKKHLASLVNLYCGNSREEKDRAIVKWKMRGVESFSKEPVLAYLEEMSDEGESETEDTSKNLTEGSFWIESADRSRDVYSRADQIPDDVIEKLRDKDTVSVESPVGTSVQIKKSWVASFRGALF